MSEELAKAILARAIAERRAAELFECLAMGGSATLNQYDSSLVLITREQLKEMFKAQ